MKSVESVCMCVCVCVRACVCNLYKFHSQGCPSLLWISLYNLGESFICLSQHNYVPVHICFIALVAILMKTVVGRNM
jgi:hypothetical protein